MRVRSWTQEKKQKKERCLKCKEKSISKSFLFFLSRYRGIYLVSFTSARPVFVWQYRCFLWQCTKAWARTCSSQRRLITTENNTTFKSPLNCVTPGNFCSSFSFFFFIQWLLLLSEGSGKVYTNIFIKNMSELYSNYFFHVLDACQNIQRKTGSNGGRFRAFLLYIYLILLLLLLLSVCMFGTFHKCLTEQTNKRKQQQFCRKSILSIKGFT